MDSKQHISTRKIVFAALMAALTVVGSALRIKVPADVVGTSAFHLGNIMCALSGLLLGPWLGGAAAAIGSALFDIVIDPAYISESWITFLTKGAYGVVDLSEGTEVIVKPRGSSGTADPLDQRSSVGWKALKTAELLVGNYLVRVESCSKRYSSTVQAN